MKKSLKIIIALAVLFVVLAALYAIAPSALYKSAIDKARKASGLTVKSIKAGDLNIAYAEGGSGETVIMLHGFGANKDNWIRFSKAITPNYHVIIPDLPGFGDSDKPANIKYNISSQAERLNQFVKQLKLSKFHIVGSSMGGNIAGMYASTYPDMVKSVTLFDASGVKGTAKSERELMIEKGINPLIVQNAGDYDRLLNFTFHKPVQIASFIKKYLAKKSAAEKTIYEKIYADAITTDYRSLEGRLDKITVPTLIIWGDNDRVVHISSMDVFKRGIKNSRSAVIKDCGHLPMMEKPDETSAIFLSFLKVVK